MQVPYIVEYDDLTKAMRAAIDAENESGAAILKSDYLSIVDCGKSPLEIKINTIAENTPQAHRVIRYWRRKLQNHTTIKAKLSCPIAKGGFSRSLWINNKKN